MWGKNDDQGSVFFFFSPIYSAKYTPLIFYLFNFKLLNSNIYFTFVSRTVWELFFLMWMWVLAETILHSSNNNSNNNSSNSTSRSDFKGVFITLDTREFSRTQVSSKWLHSKGGFSQSVGPVYFSFKGTICVNVKWPFIDSTSLTVSEFQKLL